MNHRDAAAQRDDLDRPTHRVVGRCLEVHRELAPVLPESVYDDALAYELSVAGLAVSPQHPAPIRYQSRRLAREFDRDHYVGQSIVVYLNAAFDVRPIRHGRVRTHLRGSPAFLDRPINVPILRDAIRCLPLS
jgi:GxxExxY protein